MHPLLSCDLNYQGGCVLISLLPLIHLHRSLNGVKHEGINEMMEMCSSQSSYASRYRLVASEYFIGYIKYHMMELLLWDPNACLVDCVLSSLLLGHVSLA